VATDKHVNPWVADKSECDPRPWKCAVEYLPDILGLGLGSNIREPLSRWSVLHSLNMNWRDEGRWRVRLVMNIREA
jgi:hypothetical protein